MPTREEIESQLEDTLQRYPNVPREVVRRMMVTESGGNQAAVSPKGAIGLMQLMPGTAREMGVDPTDWRQNIEGGVGYLSKQINAFGGDVQKGVAAYHAGPGNVRSAERQGLALPNTSDSIMRTPDYVRKVTGIGGSVPVADGSVTEERRIVRPVDEESPRATTLKGVYKVGDVIKEPLLSIPIQWGAPASEKPKSAWESFADDTIGSLAVGVHGAAQSLREGVRQVLGDRVVRGIDELDAVLHGQPEGANYLDSKMEAAQQSLSPEMTAAMQKEWVSSEPGKFFGPAFFDPLSYYGGFLQSLPEQLFTMYPTFKIAQAAEGLAMARAAKVALKAGAAEKAAVEIATKAGAKALERTALVAGGALEGLDQAGHSAIDVRDAINRLPDDVLDKSEAFRALVERSGGDRAAARAQLANDKAATAYVLSGIATGIFGGVGDRALLRMMGGRGPKTLLGRVLGGMFAEGGLEEAPQSYLSQVAENYAKQAANPEQQLTEGALNQAVGGAVIGALQGGAMAGIAGKAPEEQAPDMKPAVGRPTQPPPGPAAPPSQPPAAPPAPQPTQPPPSAPAAAPAEPTDEDIAARLDAAAGERHPLMQEGDVGRKADGQPFMNKRAATLALTRTGRAETHEAVELGLDTWVLRPKAQPTEGAANATAQDKDELSAGSPENAGVGRSISDDAQGALRERGSQAVNAGQTPQQRDDRASFADTARAVDRQPLPDAERADAILGGEDRAGAPIRAQARDGGVAGSTADSRRARPSQEQERPGQPARESRAPDGRTAFQGTLQGAESGAESGIRVGEQVTSGDVGAQLRGVPDVRGNKESASGQRDMRGVRGEGEAPETSEAGLAEAGKQQETSNVPRETATAPSWRERFTVMPVANNGFRVFGIRNLNAISPRFETEADAEKWASKFDANSKLGKIGVRVQDSAVPQPTEPIATPVPAPEPSPALPEPLVTPEVKQAIDHAVESGLDRHEVDDIVESAKPTEVRDKIEEAAAKAAEDQTLEPPSVMVEQAPQQQEPVAQEPTDFKKDDDGNRIWNVGDRVVLGGENEVAGRHGVISDVQKLKMISVWNFGGKEKGSTTSYHYTVRTDAGFETYASPKDIFPEPEGERPPVTPDVVWANKHYTPEQLLRMIANSRDSEKAALGRMARAKKPSMKLEHEQAAKRSRKTADEQQAVYDAWAKANGKETAAESGAPAREAAVETAGMGLLDTKDKNGKPVFVVVLKQRVSPEDFSALRTRATALGGYWYGKSRTPGFSFREREKAIEFMGVKPVEPMLAENVPPAEVERPQQTPTAPTEETATEPEPAPAVAEQQPQEQNVVTQEQEPSDGLHPEVRGSVEDRARSDEGQGAHHVQRAPENVSPAKGSRQPSEAVQRVRAENAQLGNGQTGERSERGGHTKDGRGDEVSRGERSSTSDRVPRSRRPDLPRGVTDYHPEPGAIERRGGWFQQAKTNLDIIELVKKLEEEHRYATPEEQKMLAKWSGWGASEIANGLFKGYRDREGNLILEPGYGNAQWSPLIERALKLMSQEEINAAAQSTQYAHYTSETVIRAIWNAVARIGFNGGRILEPGMGTGLFPILAPKPLMDRSSYVGIEFEPFTAKIARYLLPEQTIRNGDYTREKIPPGFFDIAIGNPPFSKTKILSDPDYARFNFSLHDYFFAKSIDAIRPGGVMAFVTSRYSMDKNSDQARQFLAARADLIGAVRLPDTAFLKNAGTEVVTDILFFQRRSPGTEYAGQPFINLKEIDIGGKKTLINEYFVDHPDMVMGEHAMSGKMYARESYTVKANKEVDLADSLNGAIQLLPEGKYAERQTTNVEKKTFDRDMNPKAQKEGSVYIGDDGELYRREFGTGKRLEEIRSSLGEAAKEWIKGYVGLRDAMKRARYDQLIEGDWKKSLSSLNKAYEAFVKKHGRILEFTEREVVETDEDGNQHTVTQRSFKNNAKLALDVESALVQALERITESGKIEKGPFLLDRVLKKSEPPKIENAQDALMVSLSDVGRLDLAHVAQLAKVDEAKVVEELGDAIYYSPTGEWQLADEYLSGDVRKKLEQAKLAADTDPAYERNVEALLKVQPLPKSAADVTIGLGSPWVPEQYYNQFAEEVLGITTDIKFIPSLGNYVGLEGTGTRQGRGSSSEWATAKRSPTEILDAAINGKSIKITETWKDDTGTHTSVDEAGTAEANEKVRRMREEFSRWVWTDSGRTGNLLDIYNEKFNNIAPRSFNGEHLRLPGLSLRYNLYPHQKRAIWRVIQTGNSYLAHAVGAGKTLEMIVSAMEQRRLGLIRLPLFVVPNHMLNQFSHEFLDAYPAADIMVADETNFTGDNRRRFVAQAAMNKPDAVVITHSAFQKIKAPEQATKKVLGSIIASMENAMEDLDTKDMAQKRMRKQLEQRIEQFKQRLLARVKSGDDVVDITEMGVDMLYVDEAHEFRKLDFITNHANVKGITPEGSQKAMDLFIKVKALEEQRPGRSHVFASGTPVTNTLGELYNIQRMMDETALIEDGLESFDAWMAQFAETELLDERNAAGKLEVVERLRRLVNAGELMTRVRSFMDVVTMSQLKDMIKLPKIRGGEPQIVLAEKSPSLSKFMKDVLEPRIEASRKWKPSRDEKANPDPLFNIITDARLASIDMRFFGAKEHKGSKLEVMVDRIAQIYKATKDIEFVDENGAKEPIKGATQIVFSAVGFGEQVAKNRGFDVRGFVNQRLKENGVKLSEIAWMSDYKSHAKKAALFAEMRAGKKRILIGSPKNMGTGVNVQKRLTALHYLSPPWFPSDEEQPRGRIVRQGNQNKEVDVIWYATKETYDSTQWGMIAGKSRMIERAMTGGQDVRRVDDISESSQYEQAAALSSGDQRVIQFTRMKRDIDSLTLLQRAHADEQYRTQREIRYRKSYLDSANKRIASLVEMIDAGAGGYITSMESNGKIAGTPFSGYGELGKAVLGRLAVLEKTKKPEGKPVVEVIGDINGFPIEVTLRKKEDISATVALQFGGQSYTSTDDLYKFNDERSDQAYAGLGKAIALTSYQVGRELDDVRNKKAEREKELAGFEKKLGAPFARLQELNDKIAEAARLRSELPEQTIAIPESDLEAEADATAAHRWEQEGGRLVSEASETANGIELHSLETPSEETIDYSAVPLPAEVVVEPTVPTPITERRIEAAKRADEITRLIAEGEQDAGAEALAAFQRDYASAPKTDDTARGAEQIKKRLTQAAQREEINEDSAQLAIWLLNQNPELAETLELKVNKRHKPGSAGSYKAAERLITLAGGRNLQGDWRGDEVTAAHEILHHAERLMPQDVQQGIRDEWARRLAGVQSWAHNIDPSLAASVVHDVLATQMGDREARQRVNERILDGTLPPEFYAMTNPSEFWAVHGSRILSDRRMAEKHGWIGKAKQWLREFVEKLKEVVGLSSDAPVIRAIEEILRGGGEFQTGRMIWDDPNGTGLRVARRGVYNAIEKPSASAHLVQKPGEVPVFGTDTTSLSQKVGDFMNNSRTFNRLLVGVQTQFHKAWKSAAFRPVFEAAQDYLLTASQLAMDAAELAPSLLPSLTRVRDVLPRALGGKGYPAKADLAAVSKAVYSATLEDKKRYTDQELRDQFKLTDHQVALFHEHRAAIDKSLDDVAASVASKHARLLSGFPPSVVAAGKMDSTRARQLYRDALSAMMRAAAELRQSIVDARAKTLRSITAQQKRELATATDEAGRDAAKIRANQARTEAERKAGEALAPIERKMKAIAEVEKEINKVFERSASLKAEGYAPLMRWGDYTVYAQSEEGESLFFGMYDTAAERNKVQRALQKLYPDAKVTAGVNPGAGSSLLRGVSPDTLELFADLLGADKDDAYQAYLKHALNNRSALKRLIHRKEVLGYDPDLPRSLAAFVTSNGRWAARNYHFGEMTRAAFEIPKEQGDVKAEAEKLVNYVQNPQEEAAGLRSYLFVHFLGGSVASALVNMTQPVLMTAPYLAQFGGVSKAAAALTAATSQMRTPTGALKAAMKMAEREGITAPHEIHQLHAEAIRGLGSNVHWRRFLTAWGSLFSLAEQFNRQLTFAAAFSMAEKGLSEINAKRIAGGQPAFKNAFDFAKRAVEETQGIYCVDEETEALTKDGWKRRSEIKTGDVLYAINEKGALVESRLVDVHTFRGEIPATKFTSGIGWAVVFTDEHKCLVQNYNSRDKKWQRIKSVLASDLKQSHHMLRVPLADATGREQVYSDDEVQLFAWVAAEGHLFAHRNVKEKRGVSLVQSESHNPQYVVEIDDLLDRLGGHYNRKVSRNGDRMICWQLRKPLWLKVHEALPGKLLSPELVSKLTVPQMRLFLDTFVKGDGHIPDEGGPVIAQKAIENIDALQAMAVLSGTTSSIGPVQSHGGRALYLAKNSKRAFVKEMARERVTLPMAWCPETEHGTWVARRNGRTFVTGNSRGNRPNWARGPVGSLAMTFKQFSIAYVEFLARLPWKERAIALAILVVAAGLEGLPFAEDIEDMIDTIGQSLGYATSSKRAMQNLAIKVLGEDLGRFAFRGVSDRLPVDVSQRIGVGNMIPGTALLKRGEPDKTREIAQAVGPIGGLAQAASRGYQALMAGDPRKAAAAAMPVAVQNVLKAADMWQRGYYADQSGRRVIDTTPVDALFKAGGLQPADVAESSRKTEDVQRDIRLAKTVEDEIAALWARGRADKEPETVERARQMLRDWNAKNPELRIRISMEQVERRVKQMRSERAERIIKSAPPELRAGVREALR